MPRFLIVHVDEHGQRLPASQPIEAELAKDALDEFLAGWPGKEAHDSFAAVEVWDLDEDEFEDLP